MRPPRISPEIPASTAEAVATAIAIAREEVQSGRYQEATETLDLAFAWLGVAKKEIRGKIARVARPFFLSTDQPAAEVQSERVH